MSEPTDAARAWAERVCARMVEVADAKGGPMLDDDVAILAAEVAPIMRERDEAQKLANEHLVARQAVQAAMSEQAKKNRSAEERARRAEEERDKLVAELSKCAWHSAIDEATEDAAKFAAGERRWKEIAADLAKAARAARNYQGGWYELADVALARYEAAKGEP